MTNRKNIGILTAAKFNASFNSQVMKKALLFINGVPPKKIPDLNGYGLIACTDGALHYLQQMSFPIEKLNFISGDFDSHESSLENIDPKKFIFTPDQDWTDFTKALDIIFSKGFVKVDVYGGSGGEMDHFLGNLSAAFRDKNKMTITFFDEFSYYFFSPKQLKIENVKDKIISLYPFPVAKGVTTSGLNWALENEDLDMTSRIGIRNFATEPVVEINYEEGNLIVFVGHHALKGSGEL